MQLAKSIIIVLLSCINCVLLCREKGSVSCEATPLADNLVFNYFLWLTSGQALCYEDSDTEVWSSVPSDSVGIHIIIVRLNCMLHPCSYIIYLQKSAGINLNHTASFQ